MKYEQLSEKQKAFCREYITDFNATRAAIAAGYTPACAQVQGATLITLPKVKEHIALLQAPKVVEHAATKERVIAELSRIAFADPRLLYDDNGNLLPVQDMQAEVAATIASVEVESRTEKSKNYPDEEYTEVKTRKVRAWDKLKALEMLAKHLQLYSDAPNVVVPVQVNIGDLKDLNDHERTLLRQLAESRLSRSQADAEAA